MMENAQSISLAHKAPTNAQGIGRTTAYTICADLCGMWPVHQAPTSTQSIGTHTVFATTSFLHFRMTSGNGEQDCDTYSISKMS